jgi:hypothetical protein
LQAEKVEEELVETAKEIETAGLLGDESESNKSFLRDLPSLETVENRPVE